MKWLRRMFNVDSPAQELPESIERVDKLSRDLQKVVEQAKKERILREQRGLR